ncbi:MAG: citrate/2-methylcitrate synthase [Bacillota bacterium]
MNLAKGLKGVLVAETRISHIDGRAGRLLYRGYLATDLARKLSYEEVIYLLFYGTLPTEEQLREMTDRMNPWRVLPHGTRAILPQLVAASPGRPMDLLRTATSFLAGELGLRPWYEQTREESMEQAVRLASAVPTLVPAIYRLSRGLEPIDPVPAYSLAENYLYMFRGERPAPEDLYALNAYLILVADHQMNASTFTGRVIASTGSDLGSVVTGALGALAGPLHGGAPSLVLDMFDEIGSIEAAEAWLRKQILEGGKIMGFGHRVYKTEDPRAALLREIASRKGGPRFEFATYLERMTLHLLEQLKPGRELNTNVEFYTAVVLEQVGIPRAFMTPTFAASRVVGWLAHALEQTEENVIIRPDARWGLSEEPLPLDR